MYIKSIKMQGFKSFADKTELTFDKGITAVVGPNGSGKSNMYSAQASTIAEAVELIGMQLGKDLGFAQCDIVAIGQNLLNKNVVNALDYFTRTKKVGRNVLILAFEGKTDESGMINGITLPAPAKVKTNEDIPEFTKYDLNATYLKSNFKKTYPISVCCGITIVQHINIIPNASQERNIYGY